MSIRPTRRTEFDADQSLAALASLQIAPAEVDTSDYVASAAIFTGGDTIFLDGFE